jgi:hypothetical protein
MTDAILPCGIVLSSHTITTLADLHIERFAQMLEVAAAGGVNVAESRYYLGLWRTIRAAAIDERELDSEQVVELYDAVNSREYDHHLTPVEFLAVVRAERIAS